MDETDSSSRVILSNVFEKLIEWRSRIEREERDLYKFKWSPFHLSVVRGYVLKLNLSSDSKLLNQARLLNDESETVGYKQENLTSFMDELRTILVVPKQHQLFEGGGAVDKHGAVAGFVDFLLRLLQCIPDSVNSVTVARIHHLQKDLRFVLAVLGDLSFVVHQHQQVLNLLTSCEAVANQAGWFVHLMFNTKPHLKKFDNKFMNGMNHLKDAVVKFAKLHQVNTTLRTAAADSDSLVIMDSLLGDLEDLLKREDDAIAKVKDHLKSLQQELKRLNSSIKICPQSEMEELKDTVMRIREVAYEAEYLINYFLDGDSPL